MTGEKQRIYDILVRRGVIVNGVFNPTVFRKIVTEPSLYAKTMQYRFNELNGEEQIETEDTTTETQVVDNEPVIEETVEPVIEKTDESVIEKTDEPEVIAEEPVVVEKTVEPIVEETAEETVEPEVVAEEPAVVEEAVAEETPKKKSKKK